MRKILFAATAAIGLALAALPAQAALIFNLTNGAGQEAAGMRVTVDQGTGGNADKLSFLIEFVPTGGNTIADLRGLFFNVANETLIAGLSATGASGPISLCLGNDNVSGCGAGNNINGLGLDFDVGANIGSNGLGGDDFQTFSFLLDHASQSLVLATFFDLSETYDMAGRVTSLGTPGSREGSSKLQGELCTVNCTPTSVPVPGVLGLLGAGLMGLGIAARRRRKS